WQTYLGLPITYLKSFYLASGDVVTQTPLAVTINEGFDMALTCSTDVAAEYMAWYIQEPGQVPSYLLQSYTKPEDLDNDRKGRLFFKYNSVAKTFPLNITKVKMSDSGTYYCAMRPTLCEEYNEDVQEHHNN
uniref:Ig-like domain-containing protein n=1 Tax=Leptobrachium leishanense TaxID=445787 RepID=A0A8C5PAV0_9ANUR